MTLDLDHLRSWIGREETADDTVTLMPVRALSATLDREEPATLRVTLFRRCGTGCISFRWQRQSEIGLDGHARRGGFLPPIPLSRRMWAGGRFQFHRPLRIGDVIRRTSRIVDITRKDGRSGPLIFVLVRHDIRNADGTAIVEEHDIVYRDLAQPGEASPPIDWRPPEPHGTARFIPTMCCCFDIQRCSSMPIASTTIGGTSPKSKAIRD